MKLVAASVGVTTHDCVSRPPTACLTSSHTPTRKSGIAMIREDDSPAASNGVEVPDPSGLPALPTAPADSKPGPKQNPDAPDMFAVGVRVLRMAPAWLLAMPVACSALVLLLGWMNAGRTDAADIYSPPLNDARSSQPAPRAAAPARRPEPAPP